MAGWVVVAQSGFGINIAGDLSILCHAPKPQGRGRLVEVRGGSTDIHKEQDHPKAI